MSRELVVALGGNPNVGKSTVFNGLTGMHQHTGNWTGKTVSVAKGLFQTAAFDYTLVDIPGTYSLLAHSPEEEAARNFLCFGQPDITVAVCDATCLERNLNLVLQMRELCPKVLLCLNLCDEAKRKGIEVDEKLLEKKLGIPVVKTVAQRKKSLLALGDSLDALAREEGPKEPFFLSYSAAIEEAVAELKPILASRLQTSLDLRWLALRLLEQDAGLIQELEEELEFSFREDSAILLGMERAFARLREEGISQEQVRDRIAGALVEKAQELCREVVSFKKTTIEDPDRRWDRILTGKITAYPLMVVLLAGILWLTVSGANIPSSLLFQGFFWLEGKGTAFLMQAGAPSWLIGALMQGGFRVLSWVVAVMLPPMAIFFPLFTLLEDIGYLPRIAYNLDRPFERCHACGKQALTMCMGFGCNAVGVTGCRIIDSPRERMIAILTNSFVPCNGRFPTLITLITLFFLGTAGGFFSSLSAALLLTGLILLGIFCTFFASRLLSATLLKGTPSSFILEMPPYRRPQVGKVLVRSVFDRTLFVLGRAAMVAAPAGVLLWCLANITPADASLLALGASFLDPLGKFFGMDGVILIAFILGLPANEIVLPIMLMLYSSQGALIPIEETGAIGQILLANGWDWSTALCVMVFSLFHWPCSTTLLTVKKETGSWGWTAAAAAFPTLFGIFICLLLRLLCH